MRAIAREMGIDRGVVHQVHQSGGRLRGVFQSNSQFGDFTVHPVHRGCLSGKGTKASAHRQAHPCHAVQHHVYE